MSSARRSGPTRRPTASHDTPLQLFRADHLAPTTPFQKDEAIMTVKLFKTPMLRSVAIVLSVALFGLSALLTTGAVDASQPTRAKPTIVLVHGAFADASSWKPVTKRLQRAGYPVMALANPLRGTLSDADYIRSVLVSMPGPIVLVAHSYGGAVITNAATGLPNVRALVYVAALIPDAKE